MNLFVFLGVLLMFSVLAYSNDGYVENMRAPSREMKKAAESELKAAKQGKHDTEKSRTRRKEINKLKCSLLKNDVRDVGGVRTVCQETYNDIPIEGLVYGRYRIGSSTMYSGQIFNKSMENRLKARLKELGFGLKKKEIDARDALEKFKEMRKNKHYKPIGEGSSSLVIYIPDETDDFKEIRIAYKLEQLFIDPEGNLNHPVIYQDVNISETRKYFGEYDTVHNSNRNQDDQAYDYCFWRADCSKAPFQDTVTNRKQKYFIPYYVLNTTARGGMCFYETNIFRVIDGLGYSQDQISSGLVDGSLDKAHSVPLENDSKTFAGLCKLFCRATDSAVSDAYYFTYETLKLLSDIYGEPTEFVLGSVAMKLPIRIVVNVDNKVGPKTYSIRLNHFDNIAVILLPSENDDKLDASSVVDIVAHELTHAILRMQRFEPRRGMGKALGESLADIVAQNVLNLIYYESDFFAQKNGTNPTSLAHWTWKFGSMWQKNSTALRCLNDTTCTNDPKAIRTIMDLGRSMEDIRKTAQTRDEHDLGAFFSSVILNMHMAQNDLDRKFLLYTYFMSSTQWTSETDFFGAAESLLRLTGTTKVGGPFVRAEKEEKKSDNTEFLYSLGPILNVFKWAGIHCHFIQPSEYGLDTCSIDICYICNPNRTHSIAYESTRPPLSDSQKQWLNSLDTVKSRK